jgi:archaellum component FlaC
MKHLKLFIVFLVLTGCSNNGKKQTNALLSKAFFLEKSINEINTIHVENAFLKYQENIELVKKCVSTIENEFARRMNNYKGLKRACPNFLTNYNFTKRNLETEIKQLKLLKLDLSNKLIPADSIPYFLEMEEKNLQKISDDLLDILNLYDFVTSTSDSLYLPIKNFAKKECLKNEI